QRQKLFRKLVRTIVVGRTRDQGRKSVGTHEGTDQEVRASLRRRIRTARMNRRVFIGKSALRDIAIHFIGRNMDKTVYAQLARNLEKNKGSSDIGCDGGIRFVNAAIDMGLGREMNNRVTALHRSFNGERVTDIPFDETVVRVASGGREIYRIPSIGKL